MVSKISYFHPYLGRWSSLTHIFFQMGWKHQPVSKEMYVIIGNLHALYTWNVWYSLCHEGLWNYVLLLYMFCMMLYDVMLLFCIIFYQWLSCHISYIILSYDMLCFIILHTYAFYLVYLKWLEKNKGCQICSIPLTLQHFGTFFQVKWGWV